MSAHNLSHADVYSAGNGLFNTKSEQPNQPRGLPVVPMGFEAYGNVAAIDVDGVATSQTPAAGTADQELVLDGVFVTDGVATIPNLARTLTITAAANDSARTFTITGFDINGDPMVENVAGPNATSLESQRAWGQVTSITVDADTAGAIQVGDGVVIGLRTRTRIDPTGSGATVLAIATEDGAIDLAGTFSPGNPVTPTATTADPRMQYTPNALDTEIAIIYVADLTTEGKGANFTG